MLNDADVFRSFCSRTLFGELLNASALWHKSVDEVVGFAAGGVACLEDQRYRFQGKLASGGPGVGQEGRDRPMQERSGLSQSSVARRGRANSYRDLKRFLSRNKASGNALLFPNEDGDPLSICTMLRYWPASSSRGRRFAESRHARSSQGLQSTVGNRRCVRNPGERHLNVLQRDLSRVQRGHPGVAMPHLLTRYRRGKASNGK